MKIEIKYTLTLTEVEASALNKVLGNLTDIQFSEICKVEGEERELIRDIWNALPNCDPDDDNGYTEP